MSYTTHLVSDITLVYGEHYFISGQLIDIFYSIYRVLTNKLYHAAHDIILGEVIFINFSFFNFKKKKYIGIKLE